jgi:hypothetical protein
MNIKIDKLTKAQIKYNEDYSEGTWFNFKRSMYN